MIIDDLRGPFMSKATPWRNNAEIPKIIRKSRTIILTQFSYHCKYSGNGNKTLNKGKNNNGTLNRYT